MPAYRRWCCFVGFTFGLLGLVAAVHAQPAKTYRIGWLGVGSPPTQSERTSGDFQQGLKDLGYVQGPGLVVEYRYGSVDRLPQLAGELVTLKVDVIVAAGESAALAAKRATNTIPVVATEILMDPVKAGIVTSLARPEANVTGLATLNEELWQKRLSMNLVLIVEDNEKNLKLVRDVLQVKGYETIEAGTAEDGLALAAQRKPDLVLMDIQLPGMNGIEALKALRANPATARIPVIAVTASVMQHDRKHITEAGFDAYLGKPLDLKEFLATVKRILERSGR